MKNLLQIQKEMAKLAQGEHGIEEIAKLSGWEETLYICPLCNQKLIEAESNFIQPVLYCNWCGYWKGNDL